MNPQLSTAFPLGVTTYYLAKAINSNGDMQELLRNKNIRDKNQIYYSSQSDSHNQLDPSKLNIAIAERLHMCLDHVGQLTRSKK